ncbi:hypothetical protein MP638_007293 [Amoeboaphelidium occidentale]|nr:hypothetical protein MP638_007293 [Amoeboaphelidium occidentale]
MLLIYVALLALVAMARSGHISFGTRFDVECVGPDCHRFRLKEYTQSLQERDQIASPQRPQNASAAPTPVSATPYTASSTDGKIKFIIECSPNKNTAFPEDFCPNVVASFKKAGDYITKIISIVEPVTVHGVLYSFCDNPQELIDGGAEASQCGSILGAGSPSSFLQLGGKEFPDALFAQPLARQVLAQTGRTSASTRASASFSQYDLEMKFNSDQNFYFSAEVMKLSKARATPRPIANNQFDFLFVVLHEMLHGLGFFSMWNLNLAGVSNLPSSFDANRALSPQLLQDSSTGELFPVSSVFDLFIVSNTRNGVKKWVDVQKTFSTGFEATASQQQTSSALNAAQQLYRDATTPGVVRFVYPQFIFDSSESSWTKLSTFDTVLNTRYSPFVSGSSLAHNDDVYKSGSDFLMTAALEPGVSMEVLMNNGIFSPLGKRATAVLVAMGYTPQPAVADVLGRTIASSATRSSMSFNTLFVLLPSLVVIMLI